MKKHITNNDIIQALSDMELFVRHSYKGAEAETLGVVHTMLESLRMTLVHDKFQDAAPNKAAEKLYGSPKKQDAIYQDRAITTLCELDSIVTNSLKAKTSKEA